LGKGELIQASDLPAPLHRQVFQGAGGAAKSQLKAALQDPERRLILDALEAHGWNRQSTATALGINRTTLYKKMKKLGLEPDCARTGSLPR
jgi:DNA-binding NtrC family response regulator